MITLLQLPPGLPRSRACDALGASRATLYRHLSPPAAPPEPRLPRTSSRKIPEAIRREVLDTLHSPRFLDQPPAEVYAELLSAGIYLCSIRTMYRLLHDLGESSERRSVRAPVRHAVPSLTATAVNQVWTWDITKLAGPAPGIFYYLYCILDLFSRYVVGWVVLDKESAALATQFIFDTVAAHGLEHTDLVLHCDRGSPMTSGTMALLCGKLGVVQSFSRPRVSDDNPFVESSFKTMKYQPDFPGRMEGLEFSRSWCGEFFDWYSHHHHHKGLALFTPAEVFFGRVAEVAAVRQRALDEAYRQAPERFVRGAPRVALPPASVSINPPLTKPDGS